MTENFNKVDASPVKRSGERKKVFETFKESIRGIRRNRPLNMVLPGDKRIALVETKKALRSERYRKFAITDGLTGLLNRRFYEQELPQELSRSKRENTNMGLAVGDLRKLKNFNDTYGHLTGDVALQLIGKILKGKSGLRHSDSACRMGGDEFAIIYSEIEKRRVEGEKLSSKEALAAAGLRILQEISSSSIDVGNGEKEKLHLDLGLTLANLSSESENATTMYKRADDASYLAKKLLNADDLKVVIASDDGFEIAFYDSVNNHFVFEKIDNATEILRERKI